MMITLALLLIGFSVLSAVLVALTHLRSDAYVGQPHSRFSGLVFVAALAGLQIAHWAWLNEGVPWVFGAPYRMLLFAVAPSFWFFAYPLLREDAALLRRQGNVVHALPVAVSAWLPSGVALPVAFLVGGCYLLALAVQLHRLRSARADYEREIWVLGGVFLIALGVAVLGIFEAQLPEKLFYAFYASAIGVAFFLVQLALARRPRLAEDVASTARQAYAGSSTLRNVDRGASLARLSALLDEGRQYQDPDLSLASLAQTMGLTGHQLSELINAELGKGFSRLLRERRVAAAKRMLCAEPQASVLSVGLSVGFSTQSNFYEAFRELEGMTPGQYRKLHSQP